MTFDASMAVHGSTEDSRVVTANVPRIGSFDFHIHTKTDLYISWDLENRGIWEPFETEVFSRICRKGGFVLDIGANIGWYSALAARLVGAEGKVYSFEPDPGNYAILRKNLALLDASGAVKTFNAAMGQSKKQGILFLSPENLGDHNLFAHHEGRQSISIDIVSLDDVFATADKLPDLVKSDTQGSEAKIFAQGGRLFQQGWRPDMILEFWPYGLTGMGDDPTALWSHLKGLGYAIFKLVEEEPFLTPLNDDMMARMLAADISPESQGFINILCMAESSDRFPQIANLIR